MPNPKEFVYSVNECVVRTNVLYGDSLILPRQSIIGHAGFDYLSPCKVTFKNGDYEGELPEEKNLNVRLGSFVEFTVVELD